MPNLVNISRPCENGTTHGLDSPSTEGGILPRGALYWQDIFRPLNAAERELAPEVVFVKGDVELLRSARLVSIIGSRDASADGLARARKLARRLVKLGVVIVSGLARGIDTAAQTATIEAGGKTIGVIGTPLSVVSPAENRNLQETIGRDHLLLSQFPEDSPVTKGNFPTRNRLMALLSDATVIVEATDISGTAYQGREALRLTRPLWILKSVVENTKLKWPSEFLECGARILSDESFSNFEDLLPKRETLPVNESSF